MPADITVDEVKEALKEVYDPEIPVNIVDLGLIYNIDVDDDSRVHVEMTLTAAGCSMARPQRRSGLIGRSGGDV